MQHYRLSAPDTLVRDERPTPEPGPHEVRVRVHAVSLNFRDLMIASGRYGAPGVVPPIIPASDAAGVVEAVGAGVTRWRVGDRVTNTFFPRWIDGRNAPELTGRTWGGGTDGVLAEAFVADASALVATPAHLSDVEASTLPCAGVTAWNALWPTAGLQPGQSVLLLGTGGVSIWALQLAHAAGLRTIVTSSSDDKLARAAALGADATIHYGRVPDWAPAVRELTGGAGVDAVLEVGGEGTLARSLAALADGGTAAVIGGVSGFGATALAPGALIGGAKRLAGVYVGSRRMQEDLGRFVAQAGLRPVVDRVFGFDEAPAAFEHLRAGRHLGKVVVQLRD